MAEPYVGEIRCFGFNFNPQGWALCNGQLLSIAENTALFTILGTTYGGDGISTFGLPNLQGRIPMHWGNGPSGFNTSIGQAQGVTDVTLTISETPAHTHALTAQEVASGGVVLRTPTPGPNTWIANSNPDGVFNSAPTLNAPFSPNAINAVGGSQPHTNMQPYLVLNFCIALDGLFPSQ
jgi:microcystin-dependent protein